MIKGLRRKFIIVIMLLVGCVLAAMLSWSLYITYFTQWDIINSTLNHAINRVLKTQDFTSCFEHIFTRHNHKSNDFSTIRYIAGIVYDLDGNMLDSSGNIEDSVESEIKDSVISSYENNAYSGYIGDIHVAWKSSIDTDGNLVVIVVDTLDIDTTIFNQIRFSVLSLILGLVFLCVFAWLLCDWMLRPVKAAWVQQRRFVADASHELKTPLAVIVANMGILQHDSSLSDDDRHWINSSIEASKQMQGLVHDLLELARTDETCAGDAEAMHKADVDFSDLVWSSALEFDTIAFEHNCEIDTQIEENIHITGDKDWLERLVTILIDNAVKYAAAASTVTIALSRSSNKAKLSVNNHGQVLSPKDLEHIFDRFYRSDEARSRQTGGYGLGLAIASGITEAHGGHISVTSNEEDGTTFSVTI